MIRHSICLTLCSALGVLKRAWSEPSYVKWFPHSFADGAIERVEAYTVLGRKRDIDEELLQSRAQPEVFVTCFFEKDICYRDFNPSVARYCGEALTSAESDSAAQGTFPE